MSTVGRPQTCDPETTERECQDDHNVKNYWKTSVYFRVLDVVTERLDERFNEESLALACAVDGLFDLDIQRSKLFLETYSGVLKINSTLLQAEMAIAKNCIQKENLAIVAHLSSSTVSCAEQQNVQNSQFTCLKKTVKKETFPNLFKCLQLAASIPISSASCERSFSAMRRIKNWLRTSMTQERFSNLSILYIEKKTFEGQYHQSRCYGNILEKTKKVTFGIDLYTK